MRKFEGLGIARRSAVVIVIVVLIVAGGASYYAYTLTQKPPLQEATITVGEFTSPFFHYLPYYVALQNGYFAKEGLNVIRDRISTPSELYTALLKGDVQFETNLYFTMPGANAGIKGLNATSVIALSYGFPFYLFVRDNLVPNISNMNFTNQVKSLANLTIAEDSAAGSAVITIMRYAFTSAGVNPNSVHFIYLGTSIANYVTAFSHNEADATYWGQPIPAVLQSDNLGRTVTSFVVPGTGNAAFSAMISTKTYISQHPDITERFVEAMLMALKFIQNNPAQTITIAQGIWNATLSPSQVTGVFNAYHYSTDGVLTQQGVSSLSTIAQAIGLVKYPLQVADLGTNQFVQQAQS